MKNKLFLFFFFLIPFFSFSQWKDGGIIKPKQIFVEYLTVTKKLTFGAFTMPMIDGATGQGLVTDGHGRLSWSTFSTPPGPSVFDSTWFDYGIFAKKQRSKRDTVQINYLVPLEIRLDTNGFLSFTEYQLDLLSHKIIAISAFKPGNSDGSYLVLNPTYVNSELASLKSGSKASIGTTADYGDGITSVVFFTAQGAGFLKQMNFDSTGFYPAPYTGPVNFGRMDHPIDTMFADHIYPPLTADLDWVQDSIDRHTDTLQALNRRLIAIIDSLNKKLNILLSLPSSDHTTSGNQLKLTAGASSNVGDVVFIAASGKTAFCKADAISNCPYCFAICADASISANNSGNWLLKGTIRDDTWNWTTGGLIYVSTTGTTGNTLTQIAPSGTDNVIMAVGIALSADIMYFFGNIISIEHI